MGSGANVPTTCVVQISELMSCNERAPRRE